MVHSKARASFKQTNVRKALYCFTNLVLQHKFSCSFKEYCETVLTPEDADDVARSYEEGFSSEDEMLPAGDTAAPAEHAELEEDEPEVVDHREPFTCPAGFTALEKPAVFFSGACTVKDLYICMLWKTDGWQLGRVKKFAPQRLRHNFDILWAEGIRGSKLSLDNYADLESLEVQEVGTWAYLRKS